MLSLTHCFFVAPATRGVTQVKRQNAALTEFSPLSPVKHSAPMASPSASAKENVVPGAKTARTTRKPLGPRSPSPPSSPVQTKAALAPATLRVRPSKENASADKENGRERDTKDRRRSQILRDVTSTRRQDENVFAPPLGNTKRAVKAERSTRDVKAQSKADLSGEGAVVTDTSKDSVRVRMKEWERERERLKEMERVKERLREAEEEREREREQEERARVEREEREHEYWERARLASVERSRERERERERERSQPQEREREYFLPKISVGPPLSPTGSALPATPLSPLFEGTCYVFIFWGPERMLTLTALRAVTVGRVTD